MSDIKSCVLSKKIELAKDGLVRCVSRIVRVSIRGWMQNIGHRCSLRIGRVVRFL